MDELNKRIIELMIRLEHSKTTFAKSLDVSLPLITHITTGRNKPGMDIIQKILSRFDRVNPEWLLLGKGEMYKELPKKQDFSNILERLNGIENSLSAQKSAISTIHNYHKLLIDEILHLKEVTDLAQKTLTELTRIEQDVEACKREIVSQ
jgi:hypothetical protein